MVIALHNWCCILYTTKRYTSIIRVCLCSCFEIFLVFFEKQNLIVWLQEEKFSNMCSQNAYVFVTIIRKQPTLGLHGRKTNYRKWNTKLQNCFQTKINYRNHTHFHGTILFMFYLFSHFSLKFSCVPSGVCVRAPLPMWRCISTSKNQMINFISDGIVTWMWKSFNNLLLLNSQTDWLQMRTCHSSVFWYIWIIALQMDFNSLGRIAHMCWRKDLKSFIRFCWVVVVFLSSPPSFSVSLSL